MKKTKRVNFRENPWRGVLKEVATELGVSVQTAHNRFRTNNKDVLELALKKIEERDELLERKKRLFR